ncbi:hypothetical protein ACDA63_03355 [Uliginosibacterium sp. sgz301328]|uniref:hypothetical protein n=1 Tax=Uliginosibacterium sp. sgz301328 TaxID=3243764 RepID=UPI00359CC7C4
MSLVRLSSINCSKKVQMANANAGAGESIPARPSRHEVKRDFCNTPRRSHACAGLSGGSHSFMSISAVFSVFAMHAAPIVREVRA